MENNGQKIEVPSDLHENPIIVDVLFWLLETREPELYKTIQLIPHKNVEDSIIAQAENLAYEY